MVCYNCRQCGTYLYSWGSWSVAVLDHMITGCPQVGVSEWMYKRGGPRHCPPPSASLYVASLGSEYYARHLLSSLNSEYWVHKKRTHTTVDRFEFDNVVFLHPTDLLPMIGLFH